jgi:uncharacterized protein (UPF0276 family)
MVTTRPPCGWLELHPENFLANPHATELLIELSAHYPISLHSVGISVGSAGGMDTAHLYRIRDLADRIDPVFVSGHLAWSTYGSEYFNDLLPLPYNRETLNLVVRHVQEVQETLSRPYLIENPASYVGFVASNMPETEFLAEVACRTRCRLLCDVSNVVVSAHNMGYDAYGYIDKFPTDAVHQLHLGGYTPEPDEATPDSQLLVDTHAAPIAEPSWDLYAYALRRFGPKPTLIEWDNALPALATLLNEASHAASIIHSVSGMPDRNMERRHVATR